jgi:hypothetical protein
MSATVQLGKQSEWDTVPNCPQCGAPWQDLWESEPDDGYLCGHCGVELKVERTTITEGRLTVTGPGEYGTLAGQRDGDDAEMQDRKAGRAR